METIGQVRTASDEQLRRRVRYRLDEEPDVDSLAISVEVEDGVVTLGGVLGSYSERLLVVERVAETPGVRRIANWLTVRPSSTDWRLSDEQIAFDVSKAIAELPGERSERISVEVERRVVTLSGTVSGTERRAQIRHAAEGVLGVAFIDNNITVLAQESRTEEVRS